MGITNNKVVAATVNATKATGRGLGRGTLYVMDYTEIGTEKMLEGICTGGSVVGRGVKVSAVKTKVSVRTHRNNLGNRMMDRMIARDERRAAKKVAEAAAEQAEATEATA